MPQAEQHAVRPYNDHAVGPAQCEQGGGGGGYRARMGYAWGGIGHAVGPAQCEQVAPQWAKFRVLVPPGSWATITSTRDSFKFMA